VQAEFKIDDEVNAAYIALLPARLVTAGCVSHTKSVDFEGSTANFDFDNEGNLIGIELLNFKFMGVD
jgi:hypothetical protein